MPARHYLPALWLVSDERNDAALEAALARLPRGSGFIFRHYHLSPAKRRARFDELARLARRFGHVVILADDAATASRWGADGIYAAPGKLGPHRAELLRLATAHSLKEIGQANRAGADAILLSPVFPTRSHPGTNTLGPLRFRLLSRFADAPIIALGGMTQKGADQLDWGLWAAIDGLS